jgi:hypothetical protein
MKQSILISILAILIFGSILTSCKKDQAVRPAPIITLIADAGYAHGDTTVFAGDTVLIGLHCTWNGTDAIKTITTFGNDAVVGTPENIPDNLSKGFDYEVTINKTDLQTEKWVFEISDSQGQKSSVTVNISLNNTIKKIWATIGAQQNATIFGYYGLTTKLNYNATDAKANQTLIDFLGAYDATNAIHLASPAAPSLPTPYDTDLASWTTKNDTKFCTPATPVTVKQFNDLSTEDLLVNSFSTVVANQKNKAKSLKTNDIYSFKTGGGKYGLFKVTSVTTGATGSVAIEIKLQK